MGSTTQYGVGGLVSREVPFSKWSAMSKIPSADRGSLKFWLTRGAATRFIFCLFCNLGAAHVRKLHGT